MKPAPGHLQSSVLAAPSVVAIALASLFWDLGHETATTLLPAFLTVILAAPPIALGLIEGVSDAVAAAAKFGGGALAARGGALRGGTAAGYITTGLATGLMALVPSWPWLVLVRPIGWAGRGWRGPLRNLLLTLSVPKQQFGRAFGVERAADNAGAVVAPVLAILVLASIHYRAGFLLAVPGHSPLAAISLSAHVGRAAGLSSCVSPDIRPPSFASSQQPPCSAALNLPAVSSPYGRPNCSFHTSVPG